MTDRSGEELFGSFAEALSSLDRLTKIESKLSVAIRNSKVPWKETRRILKCITPDEFSNTPLFQYVDSEGSSTKRSHLRLEAYIGHPWGCDLFHTRDVTGFICRFPTIRYAAKNRKSGKNRPTKICVHPRLISSSVIAFAG